MCRIFTNGKAPETNRGWRWLNPVTAAIAARGGVVSKVTKLGSQGPKEPVVESLPEGNIYLGTLEMIVSTVENIVSQGLGKYPVSIFVPNAQWNSLRAFHNRLQTGTEDPVQEYLENKESGYSDEEQDLWDRFYGASQKINSLQIHPHPREDRKNTLVERAEKEIAQLQEKENPTRRDKNRLNQLEAQLTVVSMLSAAWEATPEPQTGGEVEIEIDDELVI